MDSVIWGFIGTFIGAFSSIITTYLNNRQSNNNQLASEKFKKEEVFREFQRNNILKLQFKISNALRTLSVIQFEDYKFFHQNGKWGSNLSHAELDEKLRRYFRDLSIYKERVNDDELRKALIDFINLMAQCSLATSATEAENKMCQLTKEYEILMSIMGKQLRIYY